MLTNRLLSNPKLNRFFNNTVRPQHTLLPMNDGITISVLSRAADVIAETNNGLSGPKVVSYCNTFAVDHDIRIPHAAYPFQAGNKRTALLENLRAFPPQLQYSLLMELCADWSLRDNQEVQAIRQLIRFFPRFSGWLPVVGPGEGC